MALAVSGSAEEMNATLVLKKHIRFSQTGSINN